MGTSSNPRVALEIRALHRLLITILTRKPRKHKHRPSQRRCGEIVYTVEKLLQEEGVPMRIDEIHQAVQERLGNKVYRETVVDLLYKHARTGRILKVRRGLYASPASGLSASPPIDLTILDAVTLAAGPIKLADIHAQCEKLLGGPVSYTAIKSAASRMAGDGRLIKPAYGWYMAGARSHA